MQAFWVDRAWQMNAAVDEHAAWRCCQDSAFFPLVFILFASLDAGTAKLLRGKLRAGSAPGVRSIPIAIWRSLPGSVLRQVAELLARIENGDSWPEELLHAFCCRDIESVWRLTPTRPTPHYGP